MKKVGFIGLGNIGKGICGNLIKHGHELAVYDVYKPAMDRFEGRAYLASDPVDVLKHSDYVFLSLPSTEIVEATVASFIEAGIEGKTIIDTSTSFPMSTKKLYEDIKAAGGKLIDAPLMSGPDEAEAGILDIIVGGDKEVYDDCTDLFDTYCQRYKLVGPIGTGHLLKLAINFSSLTQALLYAQMFPVMDKAGVDPNQLFDVLEECNLRNWTSNFYTKKYAAREYRLDFALALGTKDLSYMKRVYDSFGVPAFILDGALDFCKASLAEQVPGEPPIDMSYPCETMYHILEKK